MTITVFHNKPQRGNGVGCRWNHAQKRWSWEFEDFEKTSVKIGPLRRELRIRPRRVGFWPLKVVVGFFGSLPTEILNITRCAARWGGVSIVRIVFLSSCHRRPNSEINKPVRTWNDRVRLCFVFVYVLYYFCDWSHHGIIMISCRQHGYPCPSLTTSPYRASPLAGLQGYMPYPHRAVVCMFELVVLLFLGYMKGSIGVHHLWARPCFSSSVLHVWFV